MRDPIPDAAVDVVPIRRATGRDGFSGGIVGREIRLQALLAEFPDLEK